MKNEQEGWGSQFRKGVLELAVLELLAREPMYGSQLVDELAARPELAITAGTVYPLVARLAKGGLVTSTWQESPVGPPRKYYKLTESESESESGPRTPGRDGHHLHGGRDRRARDC